MSAGDARGTGLRAGAPGEQNARVAEEGMVLGMDVGGTKVAVGAVNGARVEHVVEEPTALDSAEALLDGIEHAFHDVADKAGKPVAGVGVGVPSQIEFATGTVLSSVNIPLTGVPLRDELEGRFGVPVFVDNDANCAALAEAQLVDDAPAMHLVMLTLGTGVGGGVVIDGRIFRGTHGLGAELGHFSIEANGPECPGDCPNRGCIEAFCSGTALERDATEWGKDHPDSVLGRIHGEHGRVSGNSCVTAAGEAGDRDAILLLERLGTHLGVGIAGYVNVFEPEHFVIGGGLSRAADLFFDRAVEEAGDRALPALWERVTVSLARGGAEAGVIGAGVLAAQELERAERDTAGETPTTEGAR
jgi:glucokinase